MMGLNRLPCGKQIIRQSAKALVLLCFTAACTENLSVPPNEVQGLWIETSDDIILGFEYPDRIRVTERMIAHTMKHSPSDVTRSRWEIDGVQRKGSQIFIHSTSVSTGVQKTYKFAIEKSGWFANISAIIPNGYGGEGEFTIGRFRFGE
jgi:hypothetical protein